MQLRKKAVRSVQWIGLAQVIRQIVQFAALAILAGLLVPDDFGLLAMAVVVTGFMDMFKDLGTRVAIIQRKDPSNSFLSSIFWVNVCVGIAACLLLLIAAKAVSLFYDEPRLTAILQVLSIGFLLSAPGISAKAYLEKNMSFGAVGLIETVSAIIGAGIAIVMAIFGYGVWSLVAQAIAIAAINTLLCWYYSDWRPSWQFNWSEIRNILGFSLNYTAFTITNYLARNADYLLVGKFLGKESLGYYTLAYRIIIYPLYNISGLLNRVLFPVLSQVQDDNTLVTSGYLRVVSSVAMITFPLMLGVMALADPFVHVVLGDQWLPVIPLLVILAPVGMMLSIVSTVGPIYLIKERTGALLGWGIVNGLLLIGGIAIGLRWNIEGVAWAYLAVSLLMFYPSIFIPLRFMGLRTSNVLKKLARPLISGIAMLGVLYLIQSRVSEILMRNVWIFSLAVLVGMVVYGVISFFINRQQLYELFQLIKAQNTAPSGKGAVST